jgi:hypothetical protein
VYFYYRLNQNFTKLHLLKLLNQTEPKSSTSNLSSQFLGGGGLLSLLDSCSCGTRKALYWTKWVGPEWVPMQEEGKPFVTKHEFICV